MGHVRAQEPHPGLSFPGWVAPRSCQNAQLGRREWQRKDQVSQEVLPSSQTHVSPLVRDSRRRMRAWAGRESHRTAATWKAL